MVFLHAIVTNSTHPGFFESAVAGRLFFVRVFYSIDSFNYIDKFVVSYHIICNVLFNRWRAGISSAVINTYAGYCSVDTPSPSILLRLVGSDCHDEGRAKIHYEDFQLGLGTSKRIHKTLS